MKCQKSEVSSETKGEEKKEIKQKQKKVKNKSLRTFYEE